MHNNDNRYKPTGPYYGYFDDVSEDVPQALFIEELYDVWDLDMDNDTCPQENGGRTFCPYLPTRRGDLARYLARLEKWDLQPATGIFSDVTGDDETARAIEYMWRQGFIAVDDPDCPPVDNQRRFCPDAPLHRVNAAVFMARAFGFVETTSR